MRILFALVAWGQDYVRDFLEVSLPTLLAEGNIAAGEGLDGSQFLVLTDPVDFPTFQAHPLFGRLQRTLPTEFIDISRLRGGRDKYRVASRCQMEALRRSVVHSDAVILLYPDMIWCRNGVRFAVEKLEDGAEAVFTTAPAVLPEPTLAALAAEAAVTSTDDGRIVSVAPRNLAGTALRHHHPMWRAFDWDGDCFADYPSCLSWTVPNQGWLMRCFHLHPVALRAQPENPRFLASFNTSLDGEYVARLFDSTDGLAFADDTDTFALVTLRDAGMGPFPRPGGRPTVSAVARWAESNAFLLHRAFARVRFRWHAGQVDEAQWQAVERRSDTLLDEIRDRLRAPDSIIRTEDPKAYQARLERRYNPAFKGRITIDLPSAYAKQPRSRLTAALISTVAYRSVHGAKNLIARGPVGRWLRQWPAAIALWQRIKRTFQPESELQAAVSTKSLIRSIIAARR
jgi:hypothetical protein